MLKTLVIYESKYGSTQEVAGWLSLLLGPARLVGLHDLPADYQANDFIIIGFPIYSEQIPYNIQQFIIANQEWLQSKPVALFCTCMHLGNGQRLLDDLKELYLPAATTKALSGKLDFDRLSSKDQELLVHFRQQTGNQIKSYNHLNPAQVLSWGIVLKELRDQYLHAAPAEQLKELIDKYLLTHHTCVLTTSSSLGNRGTPIEYSIWQEQIVLLSEGGEKFAHLLLNNMVSVSVFDDYQGISSLAGLQLQGVATIVNHEHHDYFSFMQFRGINPEKLPVKLNMISIKPSKVELLHHSLKTDGYSIRQIYRYPNQKER